MTMIRSEISDFGACVGSGKILVERKGGELECRTNPTESNNARFFVGLAKNEDLNTGLNPLMLTHLVMRPLSCCSRS